MDKIFTAYLSSNGALGGNSTTLDLPATDYQFLDALDIVQCERDDELYCEIDECHDFAYLEPFLNSNGTIYELNALAKQLSKLNDRQRVAFEGLVQMEVAKRNGPIRIPTLIDLAYSTDCCHVVDEALNDSQLGRFYAENGFIPRVDELPDPAFELLDFERLGREARIGEGGVFTPCGYVVQHEELSQVYHTLELLPQKPPYAILMEGKKDGRTTQLVLPASAQEMDAALDAVSARNWGDITMKCLDCCVPHLTSAIGENDNIAHVNRLAERLAKMDAPHLSKYKAVLEAEQVDSVLEATRIAYALDDYLFTPRCTTPEDMAKDFLRSSMGEAAADDLLPFVDLWHYGQTLLQEQGGILTPYGLVSQREGQGLSLSRRGPIQGGMEMM